MDKGKEIAMTDTIGTIFGTALYAGLIGVLVGFAPVEAARKLAAFATAVAWGAVIVAIGALGGFAPGALGPVPVPGVAFALLLLALFAAWFLWPRFRDAVLAVPLPALIALNVGRLGGVFFLILEAQDRLSAPFAPVAGAGDMAVAVLAIPLAAIAAAKPGERPAWLGLWNALGALDLVVAVTLGLLSAPGTPLRLFTEGPGTLAIAALPWIMIPALLVPIYLLIHLAVWAKLRALPRAARGIVMAE
jgi:hypothetical protein